MAHPAVDVLTEICGLHELKKDTIVTKSILATAANLLLMRDEGRLKCLALLMTKLRESYATMLESVQRYKLTATKTDKLWVLFHNFTLQEGHRICHECDTALNLKAHEAFWQLLMEKEFIRQVTDTLKHPASASVVSCSGNLTLVEENAICYTAGYIIRKLETKYSKQKKLEGIEWTRALKEMAGKLSTRPETSEHQSREWTVLADRGGLYHVEDVVYYLFAALELVADKELSTIFERKGEGIGKMKKSLS